MSEIIHRINSVWLEFMNEQSSGESKPNLLVLGQSEAQALAHEQQMLCEMMGLPPFSGQFEEAYRWKGMRVDVIQEESHLEVRLFCNHEVVLP